MTGIHLETHGATLVVRIDRPEVLNALDIDSMKQLRDALREFDANDAYQVGILTGTGTRAFCVGADLKKTFPPESALAASYFADRDTSVDLGLYVRAIAIDSLHLRKPLIAAVNGHCLGGGMEMALACDLRIGSTNATFGLPEPRTASIPAMGGTSLLLRAIPTAVANKMLFTGDRIEATEAHRIGLISDLVKQDELMSTALAIAEKICANGPLAVKAVKAVSRESADLPLTQSIRNEELHWGMLRDTRDRIEGRTAFTEKRPPKWTGS
jgi:E-phenylitaconyl-CoA hydratase